MIDLYLGGCEGILARVIRRRQLPTREDEMREMTFKEKKAAIGALDRVSEHVGNVSAAAEALGVSRRTIYHWRDSGVIPAEKAVLIDDLTDGVIRKCELRPDLFE